MPEGEEIDAEHEKHAEPQQPPVRIEQIRHQRQRAGSFSCYTHQILQIVLSDHEQDGSDDRSVHGAHCRR